jgi:RHS repeat-associated protein
VSGLISERAGSTSKYYHGDQLGSTRGVTDSSQAITDSREFDSFGLTIASSGSTSTPFKFAGGQGYQADGDSGLMLLGARYYDPSTGRFINRDPIRYRGGMNLYGYCAGCPVQTADPNGLQPGGRYDDIEQAAIDAGIDAWGRMRRVPKSDQVEWGSIVYQRPDKSYTYTEPVPDEPANFDFGRINLPENTRPVAYVHTHPNYPYFSRQDVDARKIRPWYLVDPQGAILLLDPNRPANRDDWRGMPIQWIDRNGKEQWAQWIASIAPK